MFDYEFHVKHCYNFYPMSKKFGTYAKALPFDKYCAAKLISADNVVGDIYTVDVKTEGLHHQAFVTNRFGHSPAYFDGDISRQISVSKAQGNRIFAILTLVGFTESDNVSNYWAEFAIIALPSTNKQIYDKFLLRISDSIKEGKRLRVDLTDQDFNKIIDSKGSYIPTSTIPLPEKQGGTVFLKTSMSFRERMIEQARKKNIGCFIGGWAFLLICITALFFGLKALLGF